MKLSAAENESKFESVLQLPFNLLKKLFPLNDDTEFTNEFIYELESTFDSPSSSSSPDDRSMISVVPPEHDAPLIVVVSRSFRLLGSSSMQTTSGGLKRNENDFELKNTIFDGIFHT